MPTENLTRDEAATRAALVADVRTEVHLDLTRGPQQFGATATLRFTGLEPGSTTFVDCTADEVHAVVLNGEQLDLDEVVTDTRITLPTLAGDNELVVEATMAYRHEGKGLHRFVDPGDDRVYLHSQFEPFDAHLVYPCFDQPDLKTTFALTVDAPADWVVVSNERCVDRPAEGTAGAWRFATTPLLSTYVTAVVAGEYAVHRTQGDTSLWEGDGPLEMALYVRRSLADALEPDHDEILEVTRQGLAWMRDAFGRPYPFSKYDQLFVPEFAAGAMENPGCITFSESFVFRSKVTDVRRERRGEVILHEMAHMWFGDLVTMRWWDDLWLNESFATFIALLCQVEATRWDDAWVTFNDAEKAWALHQDQLPTTHPIAADMVDILSVHQNFDGITYAKGASVLRQLVAWVGQDEFLAGCRRYFDAHAWGNATLADFLGALEATSGRDLAPWTDEWLRTTGVNGLSPEVVVADDSTYARVTVVQTADEDHPTLRRHRLGVGVHDVTDAGLVRRQRVELDVDGERTEIDELVGEPAGDVLLVNDGDLTFCKLRLDDDSTVVLTDQLRRMVDPLARALVWSASWDMVRDGQLLVGHYLDLVLNNVEDESSIGVLERLLLRARSGVDRYGDQSLVAERMTRMATHARDALARAAPGSDAQLAWARHWASCARAGQQLDDVRRVLDGEVIVAGLDLDHELRWHLVVCLAAAGAADEQLIAAEERTDPTDLGMRSAATARAARPDAAAKHAAWTRLVEDRELSHTMGRQLWNGIFLMQHADVLAGFDERYLTALDEVWSTRSIDWALEFSEGCFPHPLASSQLRERVADLLDRDDLPGPLRRVLREHDHTLQRTLRARAAEARAGT